MFQRFFQRFTDQSDITIAIRKLETIDTSKLAIYSSDMSILQLLVLKNNIADYILLLDALSKALDEDILLSSFNVPTEVYEVYLRDFWTDQQHRSVDIPNTTDAFIIACVELLTIYQSRERSINHSFNTDKNLLLTAHVVNNILAVTTTMASLGS